MKDAGVQAEVAKLNLPAHLEVVPEPWIFGSDGVDRPRLFQVYMFVREKEKPDYNHYAHPLAFSPIFDPNKKAVISIDKLATGADHTVQETQTYEPTASNEYVPDALALRPDLKDLNVSQPDGASFAISEDRVLTWQKWEMRIGFNYREGLILRDVRYDGRPLFYRVSLSEMAVPYGDPRAPYHRKMAFDLGDVGAGMVANNLALGCDCLGAIKYLDGLVCDRDGTPVTMPNAVCIHEQDGGIGWKHTNYRTQRELSCSFCFGEILTRDRGVRDKKQTARTAADPDCLQLRVRQPLNRRATPNNRRYILAFVFNQAAELEYEVRATGILSTSAIDQGTQVDFGTVVHPGVLAAHHQHILSLRVDPALGSYRDGNRLVYQEAHAMPLDDFNPFGNGYRTVVTPVEKAAGLDLDSSKARVFMIQNDRIRNAVNELPVAYKVQVPPMQGLMAHPSSAHFARAEFADHSVYVTKYRENELFCGGRFTNQSENSRFPN